MSRFWPFRQRTTAPAPEPAPQPVVFRSRGLEELVAARPPGPWRVLDLGTTSNVNLAFFAGYGARYTVEELHRTVAPCRSVGRLDPDCLRHLPELLPHPPSTRFDTILAWDLLDHLGPEALPALAERLSPFCHPGTLLYALVSRGPQMPAHPQRFEVVDRGSIRFVARDHRATRSAPRYHQPALDRLAAPFAVARGFLLKKGLDEYLLEWRGEPRTSAGSPADT